MTQERTSGNEVLLGRVLKDTYQIEEIIGEGGMGVVYRAQHTAMGHQLAIKVLLPVALRGAQLEDRFLLEAKAVSQLHHPNTVRVYDFGQTDDGLLFYAMELLEGMSVRELPRDVQRDLRPALERQRRQSRQGELAAFRSGQPDTGCAAATEGLL